MSETQNLKRQLIHEAVAENVAVIEGLRRQAPRPASPRSSRWRFTLLLLLLPLAPVLFLELRHQRADARLDDLAESPALRLAESSPEAEMTPLEPAPVRSRWAEDPLPRDLRLPQRMDTSVLPLRVRHIVIDPGHGGQDHGTRSGGLTEKNLTLDIGLRLRDLLLAESFEVSMTRDADFNPSLRERVEIANEADADVFISIHINWIITRQVRGVETYFLGPTDDPELKELARLENRGSGYSLADQQRLIEGILINAHHERSLQLAGRIQRSLYGSLLSINPKLRNRGVKTAPFVVLVRTAMPAVLTEVSCLSNAEEAKLLARPLYREHIAEALFRGIHGYADDVNQTGEQGS
ncbi:MAG: N-acetylmuramoyl-L-alanine amidase [bacterium]|nr:N-acetylmuramoyl-L-alanine amidase [bacterium]